MINKLFTSTFGLLLLLGATLHTPETLAQDDSFELLTMNGLAPYEKMRKEYFIAALYLEANSQDPESIINMTGKKRLEMRISIDKWSPRRFRKEWNEAIILSNSLYQLDEFSDQIQSFTNIPAENLQAGDRLLVDLDPDSGTTVYLNGQQVLKTANNAFFNVILSTWIGNKPPSSDFKRDILAKPADDQLEARFDSLSYDESREQQVAAWLKPAKDSASKAAAAAAATAAAASSAAKAASKAAPAPVIEKPIVVLKAPEPVEKVAAKPAAKPKPKPVVKAKPKPVPVIVAKVPEVSEQEKLQNSLRKNYRSNILKRIYLNTQYPERAMSLKQEGLVVLKVTVDRDGDITEIVEEKSTDYNLLNKAAVKAVKKSTLPEAPEALLGDSFDFSLPFNFRL